MLKYPMMGALLFGLVASAQAAAAADPAPFDLAGPALRITVKRGGTSLPIAQVPNLAEGDQLSIRTDMPADQSAHYLLIAAFLRGATNPPPEKWFYQAKSWTRKGDKGLDVKVPVGARQVLLFLAPETGGDFSTLKDAVRGRPGAFVRASQDLNQALLDRSRLDRFVAEIQQPSPADPDRVTRIAPQLAQSLVIKLDPACLEKTADLQSACLMQNQDTLVLSDGHSSAISDALTGPGANLALDLSWTPQGGQGSFSPYIGAVRDLIGIFSSIHTAKYQYIAGLNIEQADRIDLLLNTAPSFHNPKSVLVAALPAVAPPHVPPLRATDADAPICAGGPELAMPVSGAPLVFSTTYAHHMALRVRDGGGHTLELPAAADVEKGGFVAAGASAKLAKLGAPLTATLHGMWGFESFDGPNVRLQVAEPGQWRPDDAAAQTPVVGRTNSFVLVGGAAGCVDGARLRLASGETRPVEWKRLAPDRLELRLPLGDVPADQLTLLVSESGLAQPDAIPLRAYAESSRIDGFSLHAGDDFGMLNGGRLDQVASLSIDGQSFQPGALTRTAQGDALQLMLAPSARKDSFVAGRALSGKVAFKDGRTATLKFEVDAPRSGIVVVERNIEAVPQTAPVQLHLTDGSELPSGATIAFSLRMTQGKWSGRETVEVAPESGGAATQLAIGKGLSLQDSQVAVASLDSGKAFDAATYGPLRIRVVQDGVASDWQPLATLVRPPTLHQLTCTQDAQAACELSGDNLYLIRSVSADSGFARAVDVPDGYVGTALKVPHPANGKLYVRLRDVPGVPNEIVTSTSSTADTSVPSGTPPTPARGGPAPK